MAEEKNNIMSEDEGINPISEENTEKVTGGVGSSSYTCPQCGSTDIETQRIPSPISSGTILTNICKACGWRWSSSFDNGGGSGALQ